MHGPPTMTAEATSLKARAVRGAAWTIVTGMGSRALGVIGTVALTYFLSPAVQGEVSDAFILVMTAQQLSGFGAAQYLVANPKGGHAVTWNVTAFLMLMGALFLGGVVLLRHPFERWLGAPTMGQYVPGLAVALLLERCAVIPERMLARRLSFRPMAVGHTLGEAIYSVASVALAMLGFGGMAVVLGNIGRSATYLAVILMASDRREWLTPAPLSPATLKRVLAYGLPLSVASFTTFASRRWDNWVVSHLFGVGTLGLYNKAYELADIPAVQVGEQVGDVLFPSFAQMDRDTRKRALLRATGLLALIVFPLAIGLGAVAPTLVAAILPPAWAGVAPMLMILSTLSVARPLGWTISAYFQASNMPRAAMWLGLAKVGFLLTALLTVGRAGPLWACGAVGLAFGGHSIACMAVVQHYEKLKVAALLSRCTKPLLACALMVIAIVAMRHGTGRMGLISARVCLPIELVTGGLAYVASAMVVARGAVHDLLGLLKVAVGRRPQEA